MNRPSSSETVIVFVPGAWHSALHWTATQRFLASHGIASLAVDLPGAGLDAPVPTGYFQPGQPGLASEKSVLYDVTLQDATDIVIDALIGTRTRYRNVMLVAHSAGGAPASAAAEQAPELLDQLVYMSAFVPAGRPRFVDYVGAEENADAIGIPSLGDPEELGAIRINPLSPDPKATDVLRRAFLNDLRPESPDSWRRLLHPDHPTSNFTTPVPVSPDRWGRISRTYLKLMDDRALPPVTQDLMISEADRRIPDQPFHVHSMPGGHSPFVTRPADLATMLTTIALRPTSR